MRTAADMVGEMLGKKYEPYSILAVSRCVRGGHWYEEVRAILREKGLMPSDEAGMEGLRKQAKNRFVEYNKPKPKPTSRKPRCP